MEGNKEVKKEKRIYLSKEERLKVETEKIKKRYNFKIKKPNGKNATGTTKIKYKDTYPKEIVEWFKNAQEKIYYEINYHKPSENQENLHYENIEDQSKELKGGVKSETPKIIRQMYPTLQRRASDHDVVPSTLTDKWAIQYPKFGDALEQCKSIQHAILLECSLNNIFNSTITQLILKNNFGYKDKQEVEHTGDMNITGIKVEVKTNN